MLGAFVIFVPTVNNKQKKFEICICADEGEAGGSEDYPHLQGEEENTLEDSKEDETADGKGDPFVPLFRNTIAVLRIQNRCLFDPGSRIRKSFFQDPGSQTHTLKA
jgi:hypothetical protein